MAEIKTVACVGAGVIGAGWVARFALAGVDVRVFDPAADTAATVERSLVAARRAWGRLTLSPPPAEGRVMIADTLEAALDGAEFVQESLPEREELKREVLARVDSLLASGVVVASSTSGLLPSNLQADMAQPQRFCVAHPFNPVYLLPLVELCGGKKTDAQTINTAATFYESLGMQPLKVRAEIDGFIADRMMEALWREALWLLHDKVASVSEIDDAIRYGCGLRWAFMGPFMTYRLGGGAGGMRHFMQQFAPSLKLPWTKLMDTPELTDELLDTIVNGSDEQAGGASVDELMRQRDDCLVAVLQGLRSCETAAGNTVRQHEMRRYQQTHHSGVADTTATATEENITAPLRLHRARVLPEWIDYNGHMTESRYLQVFGDMSDALLCFIGIDMKTANETGSYYTAETHIQHLAQARVGDILESDTQLISTDAKRLHLFHRLHCNNTTVATAEQMLLFVRDDRVCAAPAPILTTLKTIHQKHQTLPPPTTLGRHIIPADLTHRDF